MSASDGAVGALLAGGVPPPSTGVDCEMRNAEMSRASLSLNWKFGMVAVVEYAWGFLIQAKIHSRVVFWETCSSDGG